MREQDLPMSWVRLSDHFKYLYDVSHSSHNSRTHKNYIFLRTIRFIDGWSRNYFQSNHLDHGWVSTSSWCALKRWPPCLLYSCVFLYVSHTLLITNFSLVTTVQQELDRAFRNPSDICDEQNFMKADLTYLTRVINEATRLNPVLAGGIIR